LSKSNLNIWKLNHWHVWYSTKVPWELYNNNKVPWELYKNNNKITRTKSYHIAPSKTKYWQCHAHPLFRSSKGWWKVNFYRDYSGIKNNELKEINAHLTLKIGTETKAEANNLCSTIACKVLEYINYLSNNELRSTALRDVYISP